MKGRNNVSYPISSEYNHFVFTASAYFSACGLVAAAGRGGTCAYTKISYIDSTLGVESGSYSGSADTGNHYTSYTVLNGSLSKADNGYYRLGAICFTADYIYIYNTNVSNVTDLIISKSGSYSENCDIYLSISCYT